MNYGIRRTVELLKSHGFVTTDSGDGTANAVESIEEGIEFPHVFMVVNPDDLVKETERLYALMASNGVRIEPMSDDPDMPAIEGSYDPCDEAAVISLFGVHDSLLSAKN